MGLEENGFASVSIAVPNPFVINIKKKDELAKKGFTYTEGYFSAKKHPQIWNRIIKLKCKVSTDPSSPQK